MTTTKSASQTNIWLVGVLVVALITVLGTIAQQSESEAQSLNPTLRSLVVVAPDAHIADLRPGFIQVDLVSGTAPRALVEGSVLSDSDCTPDAQGVSHCRNLIDYAGARVEVRHHHKMTEEPCLSPTEAVNLMSTEAYTALQSAYH